MNYSILFVAALMIISVAYIPTTVSFPHHLDVPKSLLQNKGNVLNSHLNGRGKCLTFMNN